MGSGLGLGGTRACGLDLPGHYIDAWLYPINRGTLGWEPGDCGKAAVTPLMLTTHTAGALAGQAEDPLGSLQVHAAGQVV